VTDLPPRPRPTPDGSLRAGIDANANEVVQAAALVEPITVRDVTAAQPQPRAPSTVELQPSQVVAAAGGAIGTAARVGRLLGRSGWRIARQVPGAGTVEREAKRLQSYAAGEVRRILQPPPANSGRPSNGRASVEQRAVDYIIHNADPGTAPLRSAMSELLERSVEATRADSREYLYGTIISQLVPDEARILAALADGSRYACADVVLKQRFASTRVLLANASAVGRKAGLVSPENVPTYLTRLHGFGLVDFGPQDDSLDVQYDVLATDATIQNARNSVEPQRRGSVKLSRKTVQLSAFGREFWAASDPSRPALPSS
jgi:hypothetical protein